MSVFAFTGISGVLHAFFSWGSHLCKPHPTVSRAVQSLPLPSCPLHTPCMTQGTCACLRAQLWVVSVKHAYNWRLAKQQLKILQQCEGCKFLLGILNKCVRSTEFFYSELCYFKVTFWYETFLLPNLDFFHVLYLCLRRQPWGPHAFICGLFLDTVVRFLPELGETQV